MSIKFSEQDFLSLSNPVIKEDDDNKNVVTKPNSDKKNNLMSKIEKITYEYKNTPTRTYGGVTVPTLTEKEFSMPTDIEIRKTAVDSFSDVYDDKRQSATDESKMKTQALKEKSSELEEKVKESLANLNRNYGVAKENASNEALKRGLARSSIITNQLGELDKDRISSENAIKYQKQKEQADIDDDIKGIETALQQKLSSLDEEESNAIIKKFNEMKASYQKQKEQADEYNNKVRQQKAQLIADFLNNGINASEENSDEYKKMVADKTKEFYSYYYDFGDSALAELTADKKMLVEHLGENGYNNLKRYFN